MTTPYLVLTVILIFIFLFIYMVSTVVWGKVVSANDKKAESNKEETRWDFLHVSTITIGAIGSATFMWPFIKSMNPAEDTLALGTTEVDISNIDEGQSITVTWRGKPVFIRKRSKEDIAEAKNVNLSNLPDPEKESDRVKKEDWLILVYLEDSDAKKGKIVVENKANPEKHETKSFETKEIFNYSDYLVDTMTAHIDRERQKKES